MGNSKKIASSKRRELYNEVLMLAAKHFDKEIPADLIESISRGPGTKHPMLLCTFLLAIKELTGDSISMIVRNYNIEKEAGDKIGAKWMKYYKESKVLQKDVAIVCMLIREKHCNNNKPYE